MIQINNLSKDLGEFKLRDISLEVKEGEYLVIIGPTGAGKTILLETLAGIYPPDKGSITFDGNDITALPPRERNISMVYQDFMLFPHMNVEKNIGFGLKNKKASPDEIKKRVDEITKIFGINHLLHRYPCTLSGGEKQRAAICRAVLMDPVMLLLDEPLSALDSQTRDKLRIELKKFHGMFKTTIIHITHNYEEVFSLADRVALMNAGEILQVGSPDDLFERPASEFIARFVGIENIYGGTCVEDGTFSVQVSGVTIECDSSCIHKKDANPKLCIRSENITISKEPVAEKGLNTLPCEILDITDKGSFVKITADVGFILNSVMMKRSFLSEGLKSGDRAYACFESGSVHIFG
ncbi:ATP-binding cassette domain-containing protein [Methanoplanus sp. FWC-SCC4]|uniref:Molybdate/tungstate import ATP-binding protein WtpC n=1 Tax=Methanochimaera problematica TaxID=2609417 RepID=A0AA97I1M9_9EURY|nr:ATP-binding cassette domain-containing protein [Methanoplanus sp. FWC-SCC4]WOF15330.1 ATP-binding cassette domain-containing protein [Methanoplanus sp. FWC-SCC4]